MQKGSLFRLLNLRNPVPDRKATEQLHKIRENEHRPGKFNELIDEQ